MRVLCGTSGYDYEPWRGTFYPRDLPKSKMLSHYASRLAAVEINYSFRRNPTEKVVRGWAAQVPEGFRFALKAWQRITHHARLRNQAEDLETARAFVLAPVDEEAETEPVPDGEATAPVVIAEMSTELPRLTVGEAVMRMDLADAPVLLFRNRSHGELNVVYRRGDGNVGWIDPALEPGRGRNGNAARNDR